MPMCLRSTKRALDDLTCPMARINSSMPHQSGVAVAAAEAGAEQPAPAARTSATSARAAAALPLPAIIEIEPVPRIHPAVVLEAPDVAPQHLLDRAIPLRPVGQAHV